MKGPRVSWWAGSLIAVFYLLSALLTAYSWRIPLIVDLERLAYDQRVAATARPSDPRPAVQLVVFDEASLADAPRRSPLDRRILAEGLRRLDQMGPRAIGIDILFDRRTTPDEDRDLVATLERIRTPTWLADSPSIGNHLLERSQREALQAFLTQVDPQRRRRASPLLFADADDVVRRTGPPEAHVFGQVLAHAAGAPLVSFEAPIDFRRPVSSSGVAFEPLSIGTLVQATPDALAALSPLIRGKVVLIGGDLDNIDLHRTPLTATSGGGSTGLDERTGEARGLEIHAQIVTTLLHAQPDGLLWKVVFWTLVLVPPALGVLIGWLRIPAFVRIALVLGATALVLVANILWEADPGVQTYGLPVMGSAVSWLLMALVSGAFSNAATNTERMLAREIGYRYLPPDVARQIERRPELLDVHGRRAPLAIVFTDLAGFTTLSEELGPEALERVLNPYLDGMTEVVLRHGGTLDKFIGDAVVCFWGAPLPDPQAARRALEAALDLQAFAANHRAALAAEGIAIGETRIGAHYGEAIVGNFGSRRRVQYTAMGDAMNLAARLESANKQLSTQVIASGELIAAADWKLARDMGAIAVKGRVEPCQIFQLDRWLTAEAAVDHAALLASLRTNDSRALSELQDRLSGTPRDLAFAALNARAQAVGWSGTYRLDSK